MNGLLVDIKPPYVDVLNHSFKYHAPKPEQIPKYENIRARAKDLALFLSQMCPPSRELSLAITNLEQSVFWANAAIARNS